MSVLLSLQAIGSNAAEQMPELTALPAPTEAEINIIDLAFKGGWIMVVLLLLSLMAMYIFIQRLIVIRRAGKEDETRLFPNPAQETLFLTQKGEGKCEVKITDMLGRTQQQAVIESAHAQLDISNLSRGNYLVILTTGHKSEVKSLIIE